MTHHTNSPFDRLCNIMQQLRTPGGCSWDAKQTLTSLKPYLIEETYEVIDAIDDFEREPSDLHASQHCEELGDLLLQVVFQSQIQSEKNRFTIEDVCNAICDKLIRRHPHIFGNAESTNDGTNPHWETIKQQERENKKQQKASILDGTPKSMPALLQAARIGEKAGKTGFEWPYRSPILMSELTDEVTELKEALNENDHQHMEEEAGDVLFAVVNICRHYDINPEQALQKSVAKFKRRFQYIEQQFNNIGEMQHAGLDVLDRLWNEAKAHERNDEQFHTNT